MGIWIRNQNKEALIKANDIWADYNAIFANYVGDIHTRLGGYDSEAEAMQVLDMIQEYINNLAYVQFYRQDMDFVPPVFQMPPAEFPQPSKEPASNMEKDLDLHKEALTILLDSNEYITCDNCPLRDGCSRREVAAVCISDLRDYFLEEARESIAKAEGGSR